MRWVYLAWLKKSRWHLRLIPPSLPCRRLLGERSLTRATPNQEEALARQFVRVLQDSNRALIARLKEAQNYEQRLGYV
jgi:hypothetical protein